MKWFTYTLMALYMVSFLLAAASGVSAFTSLRNSTTTDNVDDLREAISKHMKEDVHFQHSRLSYFLVVETWLIIPIIVTLSLARSLSTVRRKKLAVLATAGGSALIIGFVVLCSFVGYLLPTNSLVGEDAQLIQSYLRFMILHALVLPAVSFLIICVTFWMNHRLSRMRQRTGTSDIS